MAGVSRFRRAQRELHVAADRALARHRHGDARGSCGFEVVRHLHVDDVLPVYADLYASGHHHGERPGYEIELLRRHGDDWVLASVPLAALGAACRTFWRACSGSDRK